MEPVIDNTALDLPFPALTPAQRYHFEVHGYVLLKNTLDSERVALLKELLLDIRRRLMAKEKVRGIYDMAVTELNVAFAIFPECDPAIFSYIVDPFLVGVAQEVCGGSVRLNSANASVRLAAPAGKRTDKYSFHLGVRPEWGTFERNGLFHTSMARTLTYLTEIEPEESTAFITGSHKLSEEITEVDIIACANEDKSLIHKVTAKAGDTVLFSESLIHSTPCTFSGRERIMITSVYTPPMYQTYNRYDMNPAAIEKFEPRYRALFTGSRGWTWTQKIRPSLGAEPQQPVPEPTPVQTV
jgi:hypothetical protein